MAQEFMAFAGRTQIAVMNGKSEAVKISIEKELFTDCTDGTIPPSGSDVWGRKAGTYSITLSYSKGQFQGKLTKQGVNCQLILGSEGISCNGCEISGSFKPAQTVAF